MVWMQYFVRMFLLLILAQNYAASPAANSVIGTIPIYIFRSDGNLIISYSSIGGGGSMSSNIVRLGP